MKVSIIIPVYNVEHYISRCVLSALNQTYNNLEIILVDDCGVDNSIAIASKVIYDHKRGNLARIIGHKKNLGLSAARNTGIFTSSGDYLYFLDADDEITTDCINLLISPTSNHELDFVISGYQVVGSIKQYPPLILKSGLVEPNERILRSYLDRKWYMMAFNKLTYKPFIVENALYFKNGIVHEDELWSFMLACKARRMFVFKEKTYLYKIRSDSITQSPTLENLESRSKIISGMVDFIKSDHSLITNKSIYNFFEELKSSYFFQILTSKVSNKFKYNFYKEIRKHNYIQTFFPFRTHEMTLARTVRNIHYILPVRAGYLYYKALLMLKKKSEARLGSKKEAKTKT